MEQAYSAEASRVQDPRTESSTAVASTSIASSSIGVGSISGFSATPPPIFAAAGPAIITIRTTIRDQRVPSATPIHDPRPARPSASRSATSASLVDDPLSYTGKFIRMSGDVFEITLRSSASGIVPPTLLDWKKQIFEFLRMNGVDVVDLPSYLRVQVVDETEDEPMPMTNLNTVLQDFVDEHGDCRYRVVVPRLSAVEPMPRSGVYDVDGVEWSGGMLYPPATDPRWGDKKIVWRTIETADIWSGFIYRNGAAPLWDLWARMAEELSRDVELVLAALENLRSGLGTMKTFRPHWNFDDIFTVMNRDPFPPREDLLLPLSDSAFTPSESYDLRPNPSRRQIFDNRAVCLVVEDIIMIIMKFSEREIRELCIKENRAIGPQYLAENRGEYEGGEYLYEGGEYLAEVRFRQTFLHISVRLKKVLQFKEDYGLFGTFMTGLLKMCDDTMETLQNDEVIAACLGNEKSGRWVWDEAEGVHVRERKEAFDRRLRANMLLEDCWSKQIKDDPTGVGLDVLLNQFCGNSCSFSLPYRYNISMCGLIPSCSAATNTFSSISTGTE